MGVIRPPWIDKKWFAQCPFNYCDHFGDKIKLASMCKVCKDELIRLEHYRRAGKDPYDMKNVFADMHDSFTQAIKLMYKGAKKWGVDLDNLDDVEIDESPRPETYPIYNKVYKYGIKVELFLKSFREVPVEADVEKIELVINALQHSRYYIIAKTARALSSRYEEEKDIFDKELNDSKTSAFLAYIAIERNSHALLVLIKQATLSMYRTKILKLAKESIKMCEELRKEFFPEEKLDFEEFGCDYFK